MTDNDKEIILLLKEKGRLDLLSKAVFKKDVSEVRNILELPYWDDYKFQKLLTPTVWHSSYTNIKKILELPYWNDRFYSQLLSSNIWRSTSAKDVEKILRLPYWKYDVFKLLFTPSIWNSRSNEIRQKIELPYWQDKELRPLLTPSLLALRTKQIIAGMELLKEYGIEKYATFACIRRNTNELRVLLDYLIENNIELVIDTGEYSKLNPIINASNNLLKEKYGIDIKELMRKESKVVNGI